MPIGFKMAWRNIWRNPRRTALTICAIAFASALLVFMLSFQFGSYDAMINTAVMVRTGHLQVQSEGYNEKKDIHRVVADPKAIGRIMNRTGGIASYTFRANAFAIAASEDRAYGVMVTGIDAIRESRTSRLAKLIRRGRFFSPDDSNHALVGSLLAQNLNIDPGDEVTLLGQGRDGSIAATVATVKGVYQSGQDEFDRKTLQLPLAYFQEVFAMNGTVHEVTAVCDSLKAVPAIKRAVASEIRHSAKGAKLVVLDWKELMPGLSQSISLDLVSGLIMYAILVLVVAFSILNTFLMAIFERTREFGVMMAIGTGPGRLFALLLIESTAMTLIGIFAGIVIGSLTTVYFQIHGIDISGASEILRQFGISGRLYPKLSWQSVSIGPGVVFLITFFAALYPAWRVRSLRPVQAMAHT